MRKSAKRIFAAVLAASLAAVSFAGCGESTSSSAAGGAASGASTAAGAGKGQVYYLNFKPEQADQFSAIAKAYTEKTGVQVKVQTAASGTYEQTLKSEMAKSDAPTIFICNGPVGYKTWGSYCADLTNADMTKHLTDNSLALKDGSKVVGLPLAVEGYGIIYNQAIMDKYFKLDGAKAKSVDEINNFAKLKAVVEDMTAKKSKLGIKGVFASTSLKSGEDWRWQTHLANVPITHELQDSNINVNSSVKEIQFKYANEYKNIFDLYLNNSVTDKKMLGSKSVGDSTGEFALGQAAMMQNGNWVWSDIGKVDGNVVDKNDVKFLPIYTGHSGEEKQGLCIGTENFACINNKASAADQKASQDFLNWLYTGEGMDYVTKNATDGGLGFIAPYDTFKGKSPDDPLAKQVSEWQNKSGIKTVPWDFTCFPSQNFKNKFGADLLSYAQGQKSWDDVKSDVVKTWKTEAAASTQS
ncbi:MAG: ABC transporter substrate-binding protein [Oscillospiraceae bacterium]|jgi:raffinose/stachyose/melibiose transport system substrate-binding protein|uniref:Extracellular solute-binding protein n=1 Tax=Caproicibacterium lactatifermentans TaxID=2666138 RepID=A0A859DPK7_9FIRM|nr:ABC transporter substrate-binding protein [Caproicibacterium lactatifermentans]MDD4808353.1 ABC transporter substrate-binding protein [Oscillospiraceae bacterium]QKN23484.1 extracellular solute-binding protein [Caproicibacterium lactatifermentans]